MIVKYAVLTNTGSLELPRASPDFIELNNAYNLRTPGKGG